MSEKRSEATASSLYGRFVFLPGARGRTVSKAEAKWTVLQHLWTKRVRTHGPTSKILGGSGRSGVARRRLWRSTGLPRPVRAVEGTCSDRTRGGRSIAPSRRRTRAERRIASCVLAPAAMGACPSSGPLPRLRRRLPRRRAELGRQGRLAQTPPEGAPRDGLLFSDPPSSSVFCAPKPGSRTWRTRLGPDRRLATRRRGLPDAARPLRSSRAAGTAADYTPQPCPRTTSKRDSPR